VVTSAGQLRFDEQVVVISGAGGPADEMTELFSTIMTNRLD
jgi:hypothetical protein